MMTRLRSWRALVLALCACAASCRGWRDTRPYNEPPPPGLEATVLDYVDTDGFDRLFEASLTNQDPVIVIRTDRDKPDWEPRLNAWIAAWNRGGRVAPEPGRTARGQAPVAINGETIREFRQLIDDLMNRVEAIARERAAWWAEERIRSRRVALLKPYSLRFHLDEEKHIQLIFFNGRYAPYYREHVQALAGTEADEPEVWTRALQCSWCKRRKETVQRAARLDPE